MRPIDADVLLAVVETGRRKLPIRDNNGMLRRYLDWDIVKYLIGKIPTIDVEPVRHGRWVKCQGKSNIWYCSECGEKINYKQNRRTYNIPKVPVWQKNKRCRNCGAKMDGGAENENT